jgi:tryptophan-rich sensory protein
LQRLQNCVAALVDCAFVQTDGASRVPDSLVCVLRQAALLILPYLAWVGFAASLNWKVVDLNPR